jgi:hypothetical protein
MDKPAATRRVRAATNRTLEILDRGGDPAFPVSLPGDVAASELTALLAQELVDLREHVAELEAIAERLPKPRAKKK